MSGIPQRLKVQLHEASGGSVALEEFWVAAEQEKFPLILFWRGIATWNKKAEVYGLLGNQKEVWKDPIGV